MNAPERPHGPDDPEPARWHPVGPDWNPEPTTPAPPRGPLPLNWFSSLDELRTERKRWDPARVSHWLVGAAVWFVVALLVFDLVWQALLIIQGNDPPTVGGGELASGLVIMLLIFVGPPVLWVAVMYRGGTWAALQTRLLFRTDHLWKDLGIGIGVGLLGLLVTVVVTVVFDALGLTTENPVVEELGRQLTWGLVFFIPIAAAVSEEVFFRGFLQPRIGMVTANVFFGFVHLSYQTPLQVLMPMVLGFLLSWAMLRRRSILPAIVGHFMFNFVGLALIKLGQDLGWETGWIPFL